MDVMDQMNLRAQCMDPKIRPLVPTMRTWGEAVTMYFEAVDEVPEHPFQLEMEVLDDIKEGQVIVCQCDAVLLSAVWGGLLSNAAVGRKAAGAITDGGVRDYKEIVDLDFPTFCKGLTPYDSLGRMDGKEQEVIEKAWEKVQGENTVREELRAGASLVKTFEKYGIL
jgi:regulator of RNase E activity RraA